MPLTEILITTLIISLFCCGLSIVTGEGMLLYFLRKPFDGITGRRDVLNNKIELWRVKYGHLCVSGVKNNREEEDEMKREHDLIIDPAYSEIRRINLTLYLFKPIILCCTCTASFWGIIIFSALHGFYVELIKYMIICCFCSCFLNAFFISKYNQAG